MEKLIPIIIIIFTILSVSCTRRSAEKQAENMTEKVSEKTRVSEDSDVDVDIAKVGGKIDLPDGFPEDLVPVYQKDAAIQVVAARNAKDDINEYVLTFQVPDEPKAVYEFYRDVPKQENQELIELGSMFTITSLIGEYDVKIAIMDISESSEDMNSGITMGVSTHKD